MKNMYQKLHQVEINGSKQWLSVRARSLEKPLLLFLHGGPGGSEMATAYTHYGKSRLEEAFIFVQWDQRASGKSYSDKIDSSTMTIKQFVEDGLTLSKFLHNEYKKVQLYLIGHSWGSILGIKMVQAEPSLFVALISESQLVNMVESEQRSLAIAMTLANEQGNKKAYRQLESLMNFDFNRENPLKYMDIQRSWLAKLGGLYYSTRKINPNMLFLAVLMSPDYKIADVFKLKRGLIYSVEKMWKEIMTVDLLSDDKKFDLPLFFLYGTADSISSPELIRDYYDMIEAPKKDLIEFHKSGHSPHIDEWDLFEETVIKLFRSL